MSSLQVYIVARAANCLESVNAFLTSHSEVLSGTSNVNYACLTVGDGQWTSHPYS